MSSGKIFLEESEEKRFLSACLEKMQVQINGLADDLKACEHNLSVRIGKNSESDQIQHGAFREAVIDLATKNNNLENKSDSFKKEISSIRDLISSIEQKIDASESKKTIEWTASLESIKKQFSQYVPVNSLKVLSEVHEANQASVAAELSKMKQKLVELDEKFLANGNAYLGIKADQDDLRKQISELGAFFERKFHSLQDRIKDLENGFAAQFASLREWVKGSIEKKASESWINTDTFDTFQKDLGHKLDIVQLDSSNAILKSSNAEKQIGILDRKIENLQILIKKELTQG